MTNTSIVESILCLQHVFSPAISFAQYFLKLQNTAHLYDSDLNIKYACPKAQTYLLPFWRLMGTILFLNLIKLVIKNKFA